MKIKFPKIFHSKIFLGVLIIVLLGFFTVELQQWRQRQAINEEIEHLIAEQQSLEQKNLDLQQSLQYFASDSYKERLAREQLGLQKEGEIVVNFPKLAEQTNANPEAPKEPSNPEKWLRYLFIN